MPTGFTFHVKWRKQYFHNPVGRGHVDPNRAWKRVARMKNDFAILIYHVGSYPKKRGGTPVGQVSEQLQNIGFVKHVNGKVGRPQIKKWDFMARLSKRNSKTEWRRDVFRIGRRVIDGQLRNIRSGYVELGKKIVDEAKNEILAIQTPPLEPATIRRKGHDKPLIETLRLLKSLRFKIVPLSSVKSSSFYGGVYEPSAQMIGSIEENEAIMNMMGLSGSSDGLTESDIDKIMSQEFGKNWEEGL